MRVLELFCHVDAFCHTFLPEWDHALRAHGQRTRRRAGRLAPSEVMTSLIHVHQVRVRDFKTYYLVYVLGHLRREFPHAVSYQRFVALTPSLVGPRCASVQTWYGQCSGRSFVDSTPLAVCHNRRIPQHRVLRDGAERGKTSLGWCSGCTVHVVINHRGALLACQLTPGNVDDRRPVRKLAERLWGRLCGAKGYLSAPLTRALLTTRRVRWVTHLKRTMANRLLLRHENVILRRRALIETVVDQLKHLVQIEHTRHRRPTNFAVNLLAGLMAYCHQPIKPSIERHGRQQLTQLIPN